MTALSLCLNWTEQTSYCSMFELFYVFRITELFFVSCNNSMVETGNRYLNIMNGIKWPSSLQSILYVILVAFELCWILTW